MFKCHRANEKYRFAGLLGFGVFFAAVFASVASVTVVAAQSTFDFEDPLEEVREKLGITSAEGAGDAATSGPGVVPEAVDSVGGMGLFAIGAAILLALVALLFWWMGRKRQAARLADEYEDDVYADGRDGEARHVLESGSRVTRERKAHIDTREEVAQRPNSSWPGASRPKSSGSFGKKTAAVAGSSTAAAAAAVILSDEAEDAVDTVQTTRASSVSRDDPSTWDKPNLDRLKSSIRDDWAEEKPGVTSHESGIDSRAETAMTTAGIQDLRTEEDEFNDLFGDEGAPIEKKAADTDASFAGQIEQLATDRATVSENDVRDDLEKGGSAAIADVVPSREDALKRIKALRESVQAG